jgi:hypothetical protein
MCQTAECNRTNKLLCDALHIGTTAIEMYSDQLADRAAPPLPLFALSAPPSAIAAVLDAPR